MVDQVQLHHVALCAVATFALVAPVPSRRGPLFRVSLRKVGGIRFLKLGRLNVSWSLSRR